MKLNYNKKIPPFKFDRESKRNIPADVNVSVAIRLFKIWCEELKFKIFVCFLQGYFKYRRNKSCIYNEVCNANGMVWLQNKFFQLER